MRAKWEGVQDAPLCVCVQRHRCCWAARLKPQALGKRGMGVEAA